MIWHTTLNLFLRTLITQQMYINVTKIASHSDLDVHKCNKNLVYNSVFTCQKIKNEGCIVLVLSFLWISEGKQKSNALHCATKEAPYKATTIRSFANILTTQLYSGPGRTNPCIMLRHKG